MFYRQKLRATLEKFLDYVSYMCGVLFSDINCVCVKDHACSDHIENLYCSCGFKLIYVMSRDTVNIPICKGKGGHPSRDPRQCSIVCRNALLLFKCIVF